MFWGLWKGCVGIFGFRGWGSWKGCVGIYGAQGPGVPKVWVETAATNRLCVLGNEVTSSCNRLTA